MRNISSAFRRALANDKRDYQNRVRFTLADNTVFDVRNDQLWDDGLYIEDAVSNDNSFQIGAAIINQCNLVLNNIYHDFSEYNFDGAKIVVYTGLNDLDDGSDEEIKLGTYEVDETSYDGSLITLTCLDNMSKFDKAYETNLQFPATLYQMVSDACSKCGVTLDTSSLNFPHKDYIVSDKPSGDNTTFRQVISWVAQIACCFARCNVDGNLEIRWYNTDEFDNFTTGIDGGVFDGKSVEWLSSYMNTETGMTVVSNTRVDDDWFRINNSIDYKFNGSAMAYLYIASNSRFEFSDSTTKPGSSTGTNYSVNICGRDGQSISVKYQTISDSSRNALKVRFHGYTRYEQTYQTREYELEYEIFFTDLGAIVINFITLPTASGYLGTTSIIEYNVTSPFTPTTDNNIALYRGSGNTWTANPATTGAYVSGDTADGGTFSPWNDGDEYDGGNFNNLTDLHFIQSSYSSQISTDNVVITGVKVIKKIKVDGASDVFEEYTSGTDGYVVVIENNDLVEGIHGQDVADWVGATVNGVQFRKATLTHPSDPSIEAGDVAFYFDENGNSYPILVSSTTFTPGNSQSTTSSAETPKKNSSQRFSQATRDYVEIRKRLSKQKTEWEEAAEDLSDRIDNASGLYCTEVVEQGATKTYYHNKPVLEESDIRMLFSSVGFTLSDDGGATWYGMTVDGTMIAAILSAIGVNADWINAGSITLGGTVGNVNGSLVVKDSSGQTIISMNKDGATSTGLFMTYNPSTGYATRMNGGRLFFFYGDATYEEIKDKTWDECYGMITSTIAATARYRGILISTPLEFAIIGKLEDDGSGNPIVSDKGYVANFVGAFGGYSERNIFYGSTRLIGAVRCGHGMDIINPSDPASSYVIRWCTYANNDNYGYLGFFESRNRFEFTGQNVGNVGLCVQGNLSVLGTKNRIVETKHYGTVGMNAFETSSSHFADIGSGTVGEDGTVTIFFDPVFEETIDEKSEYQVFLTRTSEAETSWVDKKCGYFIVHGELGATFDWMIVGYQKNYVTNRMETIEPQERLISDDPIVKEDTSAIDAVWKMVTHFNEQMEGLQNDD